MAFCPIPYFLQLQCVSNIADFKITYFLFSRLSSAAIAEAGVGTSCLTDYITIPNAFAHAAAAIVSGVAVPADDNLAIAYTTTQVGVHQICGRVFNVAESKETVSICSKLQEMYVIFTSFNIHISLARQTPFRFGVNFDRAEVATANTNPTTSELALWPGGIIGFRLTYHQVAC